MGALEATLSATSGRLSCLAAVLAAMHSPQLVTLLSTLPARHGLVDAARMVHMIYMLHLAAKVFLLPFK